MEKAMATFEVRDFKLGQFGIFHMLVPFLTFFKL